MPALQPLWKGDAPGAKGKEGEDVPGVRVYLPPPEKANGTAVIVCPGGGYGALAMDHEGHQIGQWLNSLGMAGVIVQYRLGPKYNHPIPLGDAQRALRFTRAHAKAWGIDRESIGILGFSAGGHLASSAGTQFDLGKRTADDLIDRHSCRPDFMVLLYPVITFSGPHAHLGSRKNLLGPREYSEGTSDYLSTHNRVTHLTPPTFLVHTTEDTGVPPENSILFYTALNKHKIPAELHIYEKGRHGLGLGPKHLPFSSWPQRCAAWLEGQGFLKKEKAPSEPPG